MHRTPVTPKRGLRRSAARTAAVAVGASVALGLAATGASATALDGPAGPLAVGSSFGGSLSGTATFGKRGTPATCSTGSIGATVGSPGVPLPLSALALELGACSGPSSGGAGQIRSIALLSSSGVDIETPSTAAGFDGDLRIASLAVLVSFTPSGSTTVAKCPMTFGNVRGRLRNSDHSVTLQDVPVSGGAGACIWFAPGSLTATFSGLTSGGFPITVSATP